MRYTSLPNPASHAEEDELEAAFEASDDEDDASHESSPLNPRRRSSSEYGVSTVDPVPATLSGRPPHSRNASTPAAYDFESDRYDYPPPGSPPRRDRAISNDWGNSNGVIPDGPIVGPRPSNSRPGLSWVKRVLPARIADRIAAPGGSRRVVGGGGNDGVFANVSAKPTLPRQIRDGTLGVYHAMGTHT
jgi:hypothetical protein